MNAYTKLTRELIAVPRVKIEIAIPQDMPISDLPDLASDACNEIRDALKEMIDTRTETYTAETHDGDAPEWDETDLDEAPAYEPMTLPDDVRAMLTAQLGRLDKLASETDSAGLCVRTDALYSITQSMCAIAKELRE